MRRYSATIALMIFVYPLVSLAGNLTIKPTTKLSVLMSNNTSAASSFATQSNNNLGATNISKVDVHSLLYPGSTTKVFAHLVLWFGQSDHMNVGYSSTDPAHVHAQIEDMISRGIEGIVMVWYGPNNSIDRAAQLVMKEAEAHPGFTFAIMMDHGAIEWDSCPGCTPQQTLIRHLQYLEQTYFPSPAYLRFNGQPAVTNFDIDLFYQIDWKAVKAALATSPAFLFQNSPGFGHVISQGSYSWAQPTSSDFGMNYLADFYHTGMSYPKDDTLGAAYKGFNDTLASWGLHRIMNQRCGDTWLRTFSKINGLYNAGNQLPAMQLVTWNDYEEGTEIESGIDNCLSISSSLSGSALRWNIKGNEKTVDHYTTYISTDGQHLMPLGDQPNGTRTLNMCSYSIPSGNYTLFVQAVGKPSIRNQISTAVPYSPQCAGTTPAIALAAAPSSVTIVGGHPGSSSIDVTAQSGSFNQPVALSCSNLPTGISCAFSPASVTPGSGTATSQLTISTTNTFASLHRPNLRPGKLSFYPYLFSLVAAFAGIGGVRHRKQRTARRFMLGSLFGVVLFLASCGGSSASSHTASSVGVTPGIYTIGIDGTSGGTQAVISATITIR